MGKTIIGKDQYGDWQCKYCGRYISDDRALRRREVYGYRVPVCVVCDMLLPLVEENHDFEYCQNWIVGLLNPLSHKRDAIKLSEMKVVDELEHQYPNHVVCRVYVTAKGKLSIRPRRGDGVKWRVDNDD